MICEQCGRTMTTIKGKPGKNGEVRRYFNCTGRSQRVCQGPKVTIYAEDLENMVYQCIAEKLAVLKEAKYSSHKGSGELNDLKLKVKAIERTEKQLLDTILAGGFNEDLLTIANQKASQLKRDRLALYERMEELKNQEDQAGAVVNLAKSWKTADYQRKKAVAMIMIHKILISEDGDAKIIWNV